MESRKKLAQAMIMYTYATRADLVDDLTYTEYLTQNGSAYGHVFAALKRRV